MSSESIKAFNRFIYMNYRNVLQKILETLLVDRNVWFVKHLEIGR
jgi:hypothetical protein